MNGRDKINIHFYKCGVCGKSYETVPERNDCENECLKKATERAKQLKQNDKENSLREIENAINHIETLIRIHNKLYTDETELSNYYCTHLPSNIGREFIYYEGRR